jgi:probable HAF family extracellular repeat protein/VCBS repeat-containing protein
MPTAGTNFHHNKLLSRCASGVARQRGILWEESMTTYAFTTLDPLGLGSNPIAINAAGDIIGAFNTGTTTDGFVDINGTITDLGPVGSYIVGNKPPLFINASGQVAGLDANNDIFLYSGGTSTIITSIDPNAGALVGIDAAGDVAYYTPPTPGGNDQAFLYSNGTAINIDPTLGNVFETAISNAGQVIGYPGFVYSGGSSTAIGAPPGGLSTQPEHVNSAGQVTGEFLYTASGAPVGTDYHTFLYSPGGPAVDISPTGFDNSSGSDTIIRPIAINASGEVIINASPNDNGTVHAFLYNGSSTISIEPTGSTDSRAVAINAAGEVVGTAIDSSGHEHGFLYNGSTSVEFDVPGSTTTTPTAMNASGQVVGTSDHYAFIYSNGTVTMLQPAGLQGSEAYGITDSGEVLGRYIDSNNVWHTFSATPVTTPTVVADRTGVAVGATVTVPAAHGVLSLDTDPIAGDTLHVSAVNGQASEVGQAITTALGSLILNKDGSFSYTANAKDVLPATGFAEDVFTYTATTGQGGSADATLTVTVTAAGSSYVGGQPNATITAPTGGHALVLDGSAGNDTLVAGAGAAMLIGGPGDTLTGGKGTDTFVFLGNFGHDTITNFNLSKDNLELDHTEFANLNAISHQVGNDIVIAPDVHDSITLHNVNFTLSQFLQHGHFLLV